MSNKVEIGEYCISPLPKWEAPDSELEYLNKTFLSKQAKAFRITFDKDGNPNIENTSFAGIIQLDSVRIHFSTKVRVNLFYMLSFLKSEDSFVFDPIKVIEIKEGGNFFDIIGRLFFNELEKIIEQGILKSYVKKEENVNFLKGKLLHKEQIKHNLNIKPKFYCRYHDLTCDNIENQIILRAIDLLIPMIKYNENLKYDLLRLEGFLKEEVSLNVALSKRDCEFITYNRLNQHYKSIIDFSKLIFEENFIRSVSRGKSKGFNFIVNMNQVYEDFLTEMIEEVVKSEPRFASYSVASQLTFNTLVKEKKLRTRPDIILKKGKDKYPLILDAKYKLSDSKSDYYQMIAYSLAIPSSEKACLVYPGNGKPSSVDYTVVKDLEDPNSETINLCLRTVPLFTKKDEEFNAFIQRIKANITEILADLLDM
jgi:5-methylcytosine-specific restriction endonuclease McrBC regulatory subunit McrC